MDLSKENLILTQIRGSKYRFSYEPCDEVTPSAEGIIEIDSDSHTELSDRGEVMFTDTEIIGAEFIKIQVWDVEGFQDITDTDIGVLFQRELSELIVNELL